jgi:hypothetical protein
MIKYALVCVFEHAFEGWFGASGDYDDQLAQGLIACPVCGTNDVRKQIMAPAVAGTRARGGAATAGEAHRTMMMEAMGQVRRHVLETFDYVGDRFADEARAIHEGRSDDRGIYGEASRKEVSELVRDGVQVAPLPPEPPKKGQVN